MAPVQVTERRLPDWGFDLLISAAVHRHVVAQKIVAAARAQLAECDADAKAAGLDLRVLRRATEKAEMTPADHRLEAAADRYVSAMESVAFGDVTGWSLPGALLRGHVRAELVTPQTDQPT